MEPAHRRLRPLLAALAAAAGLVPNTGRGETPDYALRADYLVKFGPFVDWPANAFAAADSPFYICVIGDDPFGGGLEKAAEGQKVAAHPIKVRRVASAEGAGDCRIVYLALPRGTIVTALAKLRGEPVLTVDEESAGVSGGIIQFQVKDGRLRFSIDTGAATANHMMISAKLLNLAAQGGG